MILNFPDEKEEDIIANLELLDRLKKYDILTFPLPLIPVATFRNRGFTILDEILEDPLKHEFIKRSILKAFDSIQGNVNILATGTNNIFERVSITLLGNFFLKIFRDRIINQLIITKA